MASLGIDFGTCYSSAARAVRVLMEKANQPGASAVVSKASGQKEVTASAAAINRGANFCSVCGSALIANAAFCAGCGQLAGSLEVRSISERGLAAGRQAGEVLHLSLPRGVGLDMIWCPPGTFVMGSPTGEVGRFDNERQHTVIVTKGFWMAKYETTQEQYEALMGSNPSKFKGRRRPVEQVSWNEAVACCDMLSRRCWNSLPSGYNTTLPTEAQWEYACRSGCTAALNSGRELTSAIASCSNLDEVSWYSENSGRQTHQVGQKQANAWGLADMHGNVCEWCLDWYDSYGGDVTDPVGPSTGSYRVHRGGSWGNDAWGCRSACRDCHTPNVHIKNLGFRPVFAAVGAGC